MEKRKGSRETVRATGENAYFAASNSAGGFQSYYRECFDDARIGRLYAVKGGPGTGKSRFLREVSEVAAARGWEREMIYCSSDPESLDGVILTRGEEGIALLDATAPHVWEPTQPGIREEIVNLGTFWDGAALRSRAAEIRALNAEKQKAYRMAYRYLESYGAVSENREELLAPYLRQGAIRRFAAKLLRDVPDGKEFTARTALIRSVGMRGAVSLDTYFAQARKIYVIEDCRGSAWLLMRDLYEIAAEKKLAVRVSKDPILPARVDGLFLLESGIAFAVCPPEACAYPCRRVSLRRFAETCRMAKIRAPLNYAERMCRAMREGAIREMERVRELHFAIERIYTEAMDFSAKEEFTKAFCDSLFPLQNG